MKVDHMGEAGAVLLSVNSTIPWGEAQEALEPNFALKSGEEALAKVIRSTALIKQQVYDSFGVGLGIGLPGTVTTTAIPSPALHR